MNQLMMRHGFWILQAPRYTLCKIINIEDQKAELSLLHESLHFALEMPHIQTVPSFTSFLTAEITAQHARGQRTEWALLKKLEFGLSYNTTGGGRFLPACPSSSEE